MFLISPQSFLCLRQSRLNLRVYELGWLLTTELLTFFAFCFTRWPARSYPMVKFTEKYLQSKFGIQILEVNLSKDMLQSKEKILAQYKAVLDQYPQQIKVATIDHISSAPSILFPVKELVELIHSY